MTVFPARKTRCDVGAAERAPRIGPVGTGVLPEETLRMPATAEVEVEVEAVQSVHEVAAEGSAQMERT